MKKIFITGASGLVGNEIANYLSLNEENVVYTSFHKKKVPGIERQIQVDLEKTDICTLNLDCDYIIHCAAEIPSIDKNDEWVGSVNRIMDDNVIRYSKEHGCKLIYISSTCLYGLNNQEWISEGTPLNIQSNYARQKRISEEKIIEYIQKYFILRISSPYGIRMKQKNVLNIYFNKSKNGEDLIYYGEGSRTQNFTNVKDIARACESCINSDAIGIFNIASSKSISMKNLAELFSRYSKEINDVNINVKRGRDFDSQEYVRNNIDISLAKVKLGWIPQISIEEGVKQLFLDTVDFRNGKRE